jgi:hypothetical protein
MEFKNYFHDQALWFYPKNSININFFKFAYNINALHTGCFDLNIFILKFLLVIYS